MTGESWGGISGLLHRVGRGPAPELEMMLTQTVYGPGPANAEAEWQELCKEFRQRQGAEGDARSAAIQGHGRIIPGDSPEQRRINECVTAVKEIKARMNGFRANYNMPLRP